MSLRKAIVTKVEGNRAETTEGVITLTGNYPFQPGEAIYTDGQYGYGLTPPTGGAAIFPQSTVGGIPVYDSEGLFYFDPRIGMRTKPQGYFAPWWGANDSRKVYLPEKKDDTLDIQVIDGVAYALSSGQYLFHRGVIKYGKYKVLTCGRIKGGAQEPLIEKPINFRSSDDKINSRVTHEDLARGLHTIFHTEKILRIYATAIKGIIYGKNSWKVTIQIDAMALTFNNLAMLISGYFELDSQKGLKILYAFTEKVPFIFITDTSAPDFELMFFIEPHNGNYGVWLAGLNKLQYSLAINDPYILNNQYNAPGERAKWARFIRTLKIYGSPDLTYKLSKNLTIIYKGTLYTSKQIIYKNTVLPIKMYRQHLSEKITILELEKYLLLSQVYPNIMNVRNMRTKSLLPARRQDNSYASEYYGYLSTKPPGYPWPKKMKDNSPFEWPRGHYVFYFYIWGMKGYPALRDESYQHADPNLYRFFGDLWVYSKKADKWQLYPGRAYQLTYMPDITAASWRKGIIFY